MCKLLVGLLVASSLFCLYSSTRITCDIALQALDVDNPEQGKAMEAASNATGHELEFAFNAAGNASNGRIMNDSGQSFVAQPASMDAVELTSSNATNTSEARTSTVQVGIIGNVKYHAPLKLLEHATAMEVDELLSMAIEKAKQSDKISGLEEKLTEANVDSKQTAPPRNMFIFHSIVSPILSAKGFQEVSIGEFLREMHYLVEINYDCFLEHAFELDSMLALQLGSAIHRKLTPLAESAAEPHPCPERLSAREAELKPFGEATPEQVDEVLVMARMSALEPDNLSLLGKAAGSSAFTLIVSPILSAKGFQELPLRGFVARVGQVAELYGRSLEHLIELDDILQPQEDVPSAKHSVLAAIFGSTAYFTACIVVAALAFFLIILLCFM